MYQACTVGSGGTCAVALAHTGAGLGWWALAGFTLLTAGLAVLRLVPRREA